MFWQPLRVAAALFSLFEMASALGSTCSTPLGAGTAAPSDPFWMQNIAHQGTSAFNPSPSSYQVFRNVKNFGAKGDGVTDDTAAIMNAMSSGGRCGQGCDSSTLYPAVVYFPQGTYLVSSPITHYYYTQMIGDAKHPPTLLASSNFNGFAVIDADPYIPNGFGAQYWVNQDNFYRSVRNMIIDCTRQAATSGAIGIHWQVSQATSLVNLQVKMSQASGNNHQGMFMENGSGGFMGDLVFTGGNIGLTIGNQQFTVRNLTVNNANTAINSLWNWGWTMQGLNINSCQVGIAMGTSTQLSSQGTGSLLITDGAISNTPTFIQTSSGSVSSASGSTTIGGSIYLNNVKLSNVGKAVAVQNGATILNGGTTTIASWAQGRVYSGSSSSGTFTQGNIATPGKASGLTDGSGKIVQKSHPQYASYATSQFVSVKSNGAKGDGKTDDTAAINSILARYAGCKIIFFDAGTYIVSSTITIPTGTQMVGEAWTVLMGSGSAFSNINNPTPVFKIGNAGESGTVEITDIVFSTRGPAGGAIVVEWNVHQSSPASAGMWDSHIRLGGAAGTNIEASCGLNPSTTGNCVAAFLGLYLTSGSSAYLEGTWVWLADHDLDGSHAQFGAYSGRGILSESQGPVWMIGTASEHHSLYQYSITNARSHYLGLIQTETAYYQPNPAAPAPFSINSAFNDPSLNGMTQGWGLVVQNSYDILVFGAGLYSFFQNWSTACSSASPAHCQSQIVSIDTSSDVRIYSLSNVGVTNQLSRGGAAVIAAAPNLAGTASTVIAWAP